MPLDRAYAATDYLIQGSAAALFKHAQVNVGKWFRKEKLDCHIIIPVHDELVMEVRRGTLLAYLTPEIEKLMVSAPEIKVKLNADFSIATYTWDKKNDYKPDTGV